MGDPRMTINHVFLAFMVLVGAAVGIVLVVHPESRDLRLSPYFWVLIAMAAFELIAFARGRALPARLYRWTRGSRGSCWRSC